MKLFWEWESERKAGQYQNRFGNAKLSTGNLGISLGNTKFRLGNTKFANWQVEVEPRFAQGLVPMASLESASHGSFSTNAPWK